MITTFVGVALYMTFIGSAPLVETETLFVESDSIPRPENVSPRASLIDLGFVELPVYKWVQIDGNLSINGERYDHILKLLFFNVDGSKVDTVFYESRSLRKEGLKFNFDSDYRVERFPGDLTLKITTEESSIVVFRVMDNGRFKTVYKGMEYSRLPTTSLRESTGDLVSDEKIRYNLKKSTKGFIVTYFGVPLEYEFSSGCPSSPELVSYMDRSNGNIYFVEKGCFLKLVNPKDVEKIKN